MRYLLLLPEAACWHLRATKKKTNVVWSGDMSNTCVCINGRAVRDPAVAVSEAEEGAGRGTLALVGDLAHSAAASVASLTRDAMLGRPGGYRHGAPPGTCQHHFLRTDEWYLAHCPLHLKSRPGQTPWW